MADELLVYSTAIMRKLATCMSVAIFALASLHALPQSPGSDSQTADAHASRAQRYLHESHPDLAAKEYTAILASDPNNLDARANLGVSLYFFNDYSKAALQLKQALAMNPELWNIEALLGICEKEMGQVGSAALDLEKAFPHLQSDKLRIQTGKQLIDIYYQADALSKAVGVVSALQQLQPTDVDILYTAHQIYSALADESLLSIAMLAPKSARMYQLMADQMERQGDNKGAISYYHKALDIDARLPGVHYELAEALSHSSSEEDQRKAEQYYKAALIENPLDEKTDCRLGALDSGRADMNGALKYYGQAIHLQPDDPDANLGYGTVLMSMNQPEKAISYLEHAVRLDPSNATGHYRLGSLYRMVGRSADSHRELEEFKRLKLLKEELRRNYEAMHIVSTDSEEQVPMGSSR